MTNILRVDPDREVDGRWIAEVPALPGAMMYGASPEDAVNAVLRLASDVVEDRKLRGEPGAGRGVGTAALTLTVGGYVAAVVRGEIDGPLIGTVEGLPGAHTHAAPLDELFLNLSEVIARVTENDSAPDNPVEERLSAREN